MTKKQPHILTDAEVRERLITRITGNGTADFTLFKGVSSEHIANVLMHRRPASKALAAALGLEMRVVTTYELAPSSNSEAGGQISSPQAAKR